MLDNKFKYYRFLEKQDDLISFWFKTQWFLIIFCCLSVGCTFFHHIAFFVSVTTTLIILVIVSFVGIKKQLHLYRLFKEASKLIYKHSNTDLHKLFTSSTKCLLATIVLDTLFAVTFPFGYVVRVIFYRNAVFIKDLLLIKE